MGEHEDTLDEVKFYWGGGRGGGMSYRKSCIR